MLFHYSAIGTSNLDASTLKSLLQGQITAFVAPAFVSYIEVANNGFVLGNESGYIIKFTINSNSNYVDIQKVRQGLSSALSNVNITGQTVGSSGTNVYTVKSGDTLSKIANAYNTSVANLIALNAAKYPSLLSNPNAINIGWQLNVTGSAQTVVNGNTVDKVLNNNQNNTGTKTPVIDDKAEKGILEQISEYFGNVGAGVVMLTAVAVVILLVKDKK